MGLWREEALELLPTLGATIAAAENPMGLWIDLHIELQQAYEQDPLDEALIANLFRYARWCEDDANDDGVMTAASLGFYEHLPLHRKVWADLPQRLSRQEFLNFKTLFQYHLSPREYESFEREFFAATEPG